MHLKHTHPTFTNTKLYDIWVFPKIGVPPKRMVYNGKPYWNGWFGGTTIFGNIHTFKGYFLIVDLGEAGEAINLGRFQGSFLKVLIQRLDEVLKSQGDSIFTYMKTITK